MSGIHPAVDGKVTYTPALDGLRAVCILFTVLNHIHGTPGWINGSVGVDIFFALSGFLITMIIADNRASDLPAYLIRRAFRIAPVYYLALATTAALALLAAHVLHDPSRAEQLPEILLPSLLFSRELANSPTLFGQAWTVGIEEKFYLGWPIFLLIVRRSDLRIGAIVVMIAGMLVADMPFIRGYCGIAFGTLAAMIYRRTGFSMNPYAASGIIVLAYIGTLLSDHPYRNLGISFGGALLVTALYARSSRLGDALATPWFAHLGRLTYSIYMFHALVMFAVKIALARLGVSEWYLLFLVGYPCCVVVAQLIYTYFEKPLIAKGRELAHRWPGSTVRAVAS